MIIIILLAIVAAVVVGWYAVYHIKRLRYGNLTLITGGVKVGKTELSVALAIKQYRAQLRKWRKACKRRAGRMSPLRRNPFCMLICPLVARATNTPRSRST